VTDTPTVYAFPHPYEEVAEDSSFIPVNIFDINSLSLGFTESQGPLSLEPLSLAPPFGVALLIVPSHVLALAYCCRETPHPGSLL